MGLTVRTLTGSDVDPALLVATVATGLYAAGLPAPTDRLLCALAVDGVAVSLGVIVMLRGG